MAKAKGTTLIAAVRFLRHHRERARELLPPELHSYLEQRIHEPTWYPEADLLALIRAVLPLIPGPRDEALALMGARTAREHLEGVYAHLSGGRDSAPTPSQAFALWASQHDTGRFEVARTGPGAMDMVVRDFGHPSEEMCGIFSGYFAETLRIEGATDVRAEKRECVLRGDERCAWHVTFSPGTPNADVP